MLQIVFDGTLSICNPCWLRFYRALQARPVVDLLPQQVQEPLPQQVQEEPLPQQVQEEEVQEIVVNVQQQQNIGIMTIPGYLRVSNTVRRCVFQNCRNVPANAVPKYFRESAANARPASSNFEPLRSEKFVKSATNV